MRHAKKMLGACLAAAFVLVVLMASSAQAEAGGKWFKNGAAIAGDTAVSGELESGTGTLLAKVNATTSIEVLCTALKFEEAVLKTEGSALGKIKFEGCVTLINKVLNKNCTPTNKGKESGVILTDLLKGLIVLNPTGTPKEEVYTLLSPDEAKEELAVIELGALCPIAEEVSVNGQIALKDCKLEGRVEKAVHLVEEYEPLTKLFVIDLKAEHMAHIDGSANVFLAAGGNWSGKPTEVDVGGKWFKNGAAIAGDTAVSGELENGTGTLLAKVNATTSIELLCTGLEFEEAVLKTEGAALGKIKFTGCITFINKVLNKNCTPTNKGKESGVLLTPLLKGVIVLHLTGTPKEEGYILVSPDGGGEALATFEFGALCPIAEEVSVNGQIALKDCKLEGRVEKAIHLVEEYEPVTKLFIIDLKEEHRAHIDGSANVFLTGGGSWSSKPA